MTNQKKVSLKSIPTIVRVNIWYTGRYRRQVGEKDTVQGSCSYHK